MPAEPSPWRLNNFEPEFDRWIELDTPSPAVRNAVLNWILERLEDPYHGARRERGFDNLWLSVIAHRDLGSGRRVVCTYWIEESSRSVRCDRIANLSYPV